MTLAVTHKFVSLKGDGTDSTLVRPSNWNDTHQIAMAAGNLVGRPSVDATGYASEIPLTAYMQALLNTADFATLAAALGLPTTGDVKLTIKTAADTGWVMFNDGTIGDASSNATTRANADTQALFTLLYNNFTDGNAPIKTAAGAATTRAAQTNAATAWANHCQIQCLIVLGRALGIAGSGSTLTSRALGNWTGEETHTLTASEIPSISSSVTASGTMTGYTSAFNCSSGNTTTGGGGFSCGGAVGVIQPTVSVSGSVSGTATSTNTGGGSHNNMQPTTFLNAMVKL